MSWYINTTIFFCFISTICLSLFLCFLFHNFPCDIRISILNTTEVFPITECSKSCNFPRNERWHLLKFVWPTMTERKLSEKLLNRLIRSNKSANGSAMFVQHVCYLFRYVGPTYLRRYFCSEGRYRLPITYYTT